MLLQSRVTISEAASAPNAETKFPNSIISNHQEFTARQWTCAFPAIFFVCSLYTVGARASEELTQEPAETEEGEKPQNQMASGNHLSENVCLPFILVFLWRRIFLGIAGHLDA